LKRKALLPGNGGVPTIVIKKFKWFSVCHPMPMNFVQYIT